MPLEDDPFLTSPNTSFPSFQERNGDIYSDRESVLHTRANMGQPHLSHPSAPRSWEDSPYRHNSESSSHSSWRGDPPSVGRRRSYLPQVHRGHMGQPFLDQSPSREPVHGVTAPMLLEFKQELARHSALLEQVLTRLDKIEAQDSTSGVNQTKKYVERTTSSGGCAVVDRRAGSMSTTSTPSSPSMSESKMFLRSSGSSSRSGTGLVAACSGKAGLM